MLKSIRCAKNRLRFFDSIQRPRVISVFRGGGFGDGLLATAGITALQRTYPTSVIEVASDCNAFKYLDRCRRYEMRSINTQRNPKTDIVFDLGPFCAASGKLAPVLLPRSQQTTAKAVYAAYHSRNPDAVVDYFRRNKLMGFEELFSHLFEIPCNLADAWIDTAAVAIPQLHYITVCVGNSSSKHAAKAWPLRKWNELVVWLSGQGITTYQVGGPEETSISGAHSWLNRPMSQQLWLLRNARLHIGSDGFLSHAASALSVPCLVLWGITPPEIWGHRNQFHIISPRYRCLWWRSKFWWKDAACAEIMDGIETDHVTAMLRNIFPQILDRVSYSLKHHNLASKR